MHYTDCGWGGIAAEETDTYFMMAGAWWEETFVDIFATYL